jgi:pyrroloquinoline quinone biosynthesis protein B
VNCNLARARSRRIEPRTQSSVAVSGDGEIWYLLNVSPDIREQLRAHPDLGPRGHQTRGTSIGGCILTDAELDHVTGLLLLREGERFSIVATPAVIECLGRAFPVARVLDAFCERSWQPLPLGEWVALESTRHGPIGLSILAFECGRAAPRYAHNGGDTVGARIGLVVEDGRTRRRLIYAPGVPGPIPPLASAAREAAGILLDGTFWSEDELAGTIKGHRGARSMGHWPVAGPDGSLPWLSAQPAAHRMYVHVNNTNPMLLSDGPERAEVERAGVRIGADGDSFEL